MILYSALFSTQCYKVRIKSKVEQSRHPPLHLGVVAVEKGAFGSPLTKLTNFTFIYLKSFLDEVLLILNRIFFHL